jgi:hypothetical protein
MRLSREDSNHPHRKTNERYSVGCCKYTDNNSSELCQVRSVCVSLTFYTDHHLLRPVPLDHRIEGNNIVENLLDDEIMKGIVFWDVTSVEICRRFGRTHCLSPHGWRVTRTSKKQAGNRVNTEYSACCSLLESSTCSSTVKMEAVSYSEISVTSTRLHGVPPKKIVLVLVDVILIENLCLYWKNVFITNLCFWTTAICLFRLRSKILPLRYHWTK